MLETWLSKSTLIVTRLAESSLLEARLSKATLWVTVATSEWTVTLWHSHGNSHKGKSYSNLPDKSKGKIELMLSNFISYFEILLFCCGVCNKAFIDFITFNILNGYPL